jgi:2-polyprenyl-3-methyl-5-hydroxy-6-metoxy-1,4-benzoquinol methylase
MKEGTQIYGAKFHARLRKREEVYRTLARACIMTYNASKCENPKDVCDVGCSSGILLRSFKEALPPMQTDGIDYSVNPEDMVFEGKFVEQNLNTYAGEIKGNYDLVTSFEVLEHVEPENTERAIQLIADLAHPGSMLIFGAAKPGQRGTHHVNCRTKEVWIWYLTKYGWDYNLEAHTLFNKLLDASGVIPGLCAYYRNNTFVMIKK